MPWIPGEYPDRPRQNMLPDWKDEDALVDYVKQVISDLLLGPDPEGSKCKYGVWPFEFHSGIKTWDMLESEAVAAAEGGNYAPLAELLDSRHPLNNHQNKPPICSALKPSTYALIGDILSGRRKKPGRPKLTEFQRRMINPIHNAADDVHVVGVCCVRGTPSGRRSIFTTGHYSSLHASMR